MMPEHRMAAGSERHQATPESPIGKTRQFRRARHACIRAEIRVGIHIQHMENPIAQTHIDAPVIAAPGGGIGRSRRFAQKLELFFEQRRRKKGLDHSVVERFRVKLGIIGAKPLTNIREGRKVHFRHGQGNQPVTPPKRNAKFPPIDKIFHQRRLMQVIENEAHSSFELAAWSRPPPPAVMPMLQCSWTGFTIAGNPSQPSTLAVS